MATIKKIILTIFIIGAIGIGSSVLAYFYFARNLPTVEQIKERQISQSTKIYDRTGTVLLYEISGEQNRTVVPFENIPPYLKDATIAIEDENFYQEPAFSWRGILRALLTNIIHGQILQGGSTITQQLARNAFLTTDQTIGRKIREFILAVRLNRYYSKDQILALYLNEIPYGPTIYGIEKASRSYFNKSVSDLNLAESAVLAAIPKAPTYYSPWGSHLYDLMNRRKLILQKMLELGKITKKEFDSAVAYKIVFAPQGEKIKAPHFVIAVQDYLVQKYGENMVRRGGLKVITTLDWNLEQAAEKAVASGAAQNESLYQGKNATLAAEDPKTGQILALVGSRDYFDIKNEGNFDVATQGLRQPGSALKPFVYLTAFEKGYTPDAVVFDLPTEFAANNPLCPPNPDFNNDNKKCFHPQNFDGQFRGPVAFRQALAQSINVPAVRVLYLAGLNDSVKNAYNFGLTTLTSPALYGLSLVLGGGAVRLIDLVGAYSVLAQDGIKHDQSMILEIKDSDGNVLESYQDQNTRVADPQPVRLVNNILSDAEARRGLFQNSLSLTVFPDHDVALKTGTSDDYRDAWAIGYTPSLVTGVWAGNNDNSPMQRHGSSILAAVPIWHNFMAEAVKNLPLETFNRPDPVNPQKPILAGDYLYNKQIHTILYYVDRENPEGPPPANPAGDPQFSNWEYGVLTWAKDNLPDFADYNKPLPQVANAATSTMLNVPPKIEIKNPRVGSFIGNQVNINASVTGLSAIKKIRVYFNNQLIDDFNANGGINYDFNWSFAPTNPQPQNMLQVEAVDQNGLSNREEVIIYAQQ
jgi:penicillin-binding protein 1C